MTPQDKMTKARGRVSMKHPFFAAFLIRMNVVELTDELTKRVFGSALTPTMCTDGKTIWWSPAFVDTLEVEEVEGVLVHEVLHIVFKHHLRRGDRDGMKWNIAADYVIDPIVIESGQADSRATYRLPTGPGMEQHHDTRYDGKTVEQVYNLLPDQPKQPQGGQGKPGDGEQTSGIGGVIDPTNEDGSPLTESQKAMAESDVDQQVIIAAETAKSQGKLPAGLEGYVEKLREPQVDWQDKVRRFVGGEHPDDYTYNKPARKQFVMIRTYEPSVEFTGVGHLVIAADASGSVSNAEFEHFVGEMNGICVDLMPEKITVIQFESQVSHVDEYDQGDEIDNTNIRRAGFGGTCVQPVFRYIDEHIHDLQKLIFLTDLGIGDFGDMPPYPVLWVSTMDGEAPYGETVKINVEGVR